MGNGPLRSDLLGDNDRLQKCAQSDQFHVEPGEPASDHVRLIQEALRKVHGADIPASERNYGDKTTKAVVDFKTKHRLFTRGTQSIDPIVGTGTSRKLDELMKQLEARGKTVPTPTKVVPRLALSGACQLIGELQDNPQADDLKVGDGLAARKRLTTAALTAPFTIMPDSTLEGMMVASMATAVTVAAGATGSLSARAESLLMCHHFFSAAGAQRDFAKGSKISDEAKLDTGFINFSSKVEFEVNRVVRTAWKAGLVDDAAIAATLRPTLDSPSFGTGQFSNALAAFIGGFQGYRVQMCNLSADTAAETFDYTLEIEILDHFGVDDGDINRNQGPMGTAIGAAMIPFFVLQHDRNSGGLNRRMNKYRPFRVTLLADMGPFSGKVF